MNERAHIPLAVISQFRRGPPALTTISKDGSAPLGQHSTVSVLAHKPPPARRSHEVREVGSFGDGVFLSFQSATLMTTRAMDSSPSLLLRFERRPYQVHSPSYLSADGVIGGIARTVTGPGPDPDAVLL